MPLPWEEYQDALPKKPWEEIAEAAGDNVLEDVAKSGAAALPRGVADLVASPGFFKTIAEAGTAMSEFGRSMMPESMGGLYEAQDRALGALKSATDFIPDAQDARGALSAVTGGATDYQPQTTPGEYARTIGEFLPSAALTSLGGGGGVLGSIANMLRYGVVPAVTSETAGQLTEGTPLEPVARALGAVGGGVLGSVGARGPAALPSAKEIKASAGYTDIKEPMKAAQVNKGTYKTLVNELKAVVDDFGFVPELHGPAQTILNRHAANARKGGTSVYDLELMRRSFLNAGKNHQNPSLGELSGKLIDKLDDAVEGLDDAVVPALKDARAIYSRGKKSQLIEQAIEKAQHQASGVENGLSIQFRKILDSPKLSRQFSDDERALIKDVANGNFTRNALRWLGTFGVPIDQGRNFLGSFMGGGAGGALGSVIGGPAGGFVGGVALPLAGTAAKVGARRLAEAQANLAETAVKSGSADAAMAQRNAGSNDQFQRLLRAFLQGELATRQAGN